MSVRTFHTGMMPYKYTNQFKARFIYQMQKPESNKLVNA